MFDIGFLELAVILVLSLLVLGPERLPKAARTVGYWFGKARRYVEGMKSQVEAELDASEVKRLLHNQEVQIRELQSKLQDGENFIDQDYHNQFENKLDPGTAEAVDETSDAQQQKPSAPLYDIIEEDDDEWDELKERNPTKAVSDTKEDVPSEDEKQDASVTQDKAS